MQFANINYVNKIKGTTNTNIDSANTIILLL